MKTTQVKLIKTKFLSFISTVWITTVTVLGIVVLFNWIIDPYGVLNSPPLHGLNWLKPEKTLSQGRLFKAIEVTRIKPKTIFLGSSKVEYGLDPTQPSLVDKQPTYNLGLSAPNMYEVRRYFQHALTNQPKLQHVIVGVDFFMFNAFQETQPTFKENRLEKQSINLQDLRNVTLSLDALKASIKTLNFNRDHPKSFSPYGASGMRNEIYDFQTKNKSLLGSFKNSIKFFLGNFYNKYQLSNEQLNNLQTIINTCQQRGIDLKIFISPSHAALLEAIRVAGIWQEFEQWKRELSEMAPVWDFSGYSSITSESISNTKNYLDAAHYRKKIGNLVLNCLFSYQEATVPADFGTLITPANLEAHLAKIRADREVWAKNNPNIVNLVQDLAGIA